MQVNAELGKGKRENIKVEAILNLLRSYLLPGNREQIAQELNAPEIRQILEFREADNDFDVKRIVEPMAGLLQMAQTVPRPSSDCERKLAHLSGRPIQK